MARLKAHGKELARRETPTGRIAVMSDGWLLRDQGAGWKQWKRLKAGVDAAAWAHGFALRTQAIHPLVRAYVKALMAATDVAHRGRLHMTIELMPEDPDGVWAQMEDFSYTYDLEDIIRACRAYLVARQAVEGAGGTAAAGGAA